METIIMTTFDTPTAIDLAITLQVGAIEIIASDRTDTVVTVTPTNPAQPVDVRGAEETTVAFDGERLTVTGPKARISWIGPTESVDLRIELPTGSRLTAELAVGNVLTLGRLGATRIKDSMGAVDVDATGDLWLRVGHGNATAGGAEGDLQITTDHGQVRVGSVSGDATLKASHGSITVGRASGALEAKLSYGDLDVTTALASVTATTAYGSIRLGEVASGSISASSGFGQVAIGIRPGVAAWLDLASKAGHIRNALPSEGAPADNEHTVAVLARTQFGDIVVTRAVGESP
jgi:hypothetical protein